MDTTKSVHHRIDWIDFGKGFTIFLVVISHALGGIYANGIYNDNLNNVIRIIGNSLFIFIMPVFFSLSGYLFKNIKSFSDYLLMIRKKAWNLLTPYVIFSIIYILMNQVGGENSKYTWNSLLHIYVKPISYLWFLYILFFIFILVGILSLIRIDIKIQSWIYLLAFIIVRFRESNIYLLTIFGWAFFFCLGAIFKSHVDLLKNKSCLCISFTLTIISMIILPFCLGVNHNYYNYVSLINIVPKIISDIFMFSLFLNFPKHTKFFSYFRKYGKYSLIVYMIHAPLLSASRTVILKFGLINELILIIVLVLIGWYGSLIVVWLNNRFKIVRFVFNAYSTIHPKHLNLDRS